MDQREIELSLRSYLLNPLRHWTKYPFFVPVVSSVSEAPIRDRAGNQARRTATQANFQSITQPGETDPLSVGIYITDVRANEVVTLFSKLLMNVEYGVIVDFDSFANSVQSRDSTLVLAQDIANAFYKYNDLDIIKPVYFDGNSLEEEDSFKYEVHSSYYIRDLSSDEPKFGYKLLKLGETRLVETGDNQFPIIRPLPSERNEPYFLYREPIDGMLYDPGQNFRYRIVNPDNLDIIYTPETPDRNRESENYNRVQILNYQYDPLDPDSLEYIPKDVGFLEDQDNGLVIAAYDQTAADNDRKVVYFTPVIERLFDSNQVIEVRDTVYVFIDQDDPGAEVRNTIGLRITDADTTTYNVRKVDTRLKVDFTDLLPSTETMMALTEEQVERIIDRKLVEFEARLDNKYAQLAGATFTGQASGITPTSNKGFATKDYVDTHQGVATKTFTGYVAWSSDIAFTAAEFKAGTSFTDALAAAIPAQSGFAYLGQWFIGDEWSDISEVHIDYGQNMFDELSEAVNLTIDGVAGKYRRIAVKLAGTVVGGEILRWRS